MSIRDKLLAAFGVVLVLAAFVAFFGIYAISGAGGLVVRLYDEPFMAVSHARAAQAKFNEARSAMEHGLGAGGPAPQSTVKALEAAVKETAEEFGIVRERLLEPEAAQLLKKAEALVEDWHRSWLKIAAAPAGGAADRAASEAVVRKAAAVAEAIDGVVEAASAFGFQFRSEAETKVAESRFILIALASVTGVIGLLLSLGVAYSFARPIKHAMGIAERIAAGNLTQDVSTNRRDELGRLLVSLGEMQEVLRSKIDADRRAVEAKEREQQKEVELLQEAANERQRAEAERRKYADEQALVVKSLADGLAKLAEGQLTFHLREGFTDAYVKIRDDFNDTIGRLRETIGEIAESTHEILDAAVEISTSSEDLLERTEQQSASLEATSASMEEISSTVRKNADHAQHANQLTTGACDVATRGSKVVGEAVNAMSRIADASKQISDIIGVIDEIARQTNLLALNAAVEAARAGEAGRGFAVVASEVRSLAQRSSQAAKDIKDLIGHSALQVKDGVNLVNRAGGSLSEIIEAIKGVAGIVGDMANASAEQAIGLDQINKVLAQMDEATRQNSALAKKNAATTASLKDVSGFMTERVGFFTHSVADAAGGARTAVSGKVKSKAAAA